MGTDALIAELIAAPLQAPFAEDMLLEDHGQRRVFRGRRQVLPVLRAYFGGGFPDGRMCVETTVANEKSAVITFIFRGRQDGIFLGLPATRREVAVPMILLCRLTDQQILHIAWYYDAGTMLQQLGLAS